MEAETHTGHVDALKGRWRGPAGQRLCFALILAGLAAALTAQAWRIGVAVDGPAHLLSSYLYWHGADRLKPRDMPPLIKIAGGWVPALLGLPVPYDHPAWKQQHEWLISLAMLERMRADQIRQVFFLSRLPLLIFPLLTLLLLWRWARELFGGWVAVLIALAFALEPNALAHGALFKNDLAATFGYLLFWYAAWRFWKEPGMRRAALLGLGLLLAILAKLSMLVLVAVAPALVVLRFLARRRSSVWQAVVCVAIVLLIAYVGTLAAYQFEARRLTAQDLATLRADPSMPKLFVSLAPVFRVAPVAVPMWEGAISLIHSDASGNPVYLWGKIYERGHPLYFVAALAVKAPSVLQMLGLGGLFLLGLKIKRKQFVATDLFWVAPPFFYIGLASLSTLQLGVRLILPALPFGLLICGVAIGWLMRGRRAWVLAGLFVWFAVRSIQAFPHGIAYFNIWSGGPEHGLDYLADSNLDWGQDLRSLAAWVQENKIPKLYLSYFGTDNPWAYFRESQLTLLAPPWDPSLVKGPVPYQPEPGYYAISATLLPGHFFARRYRDFYKRFREMEPIARVGYSIYIYKVE